MPHADLRREATVVIAKPALAPCMMIAGMGVWACGCVLGGGMNDAMGSKTRVKLFRPSFSTGGSNRKSPVFRLDPPVGKLSRKKLSRKSSFSSV